MRRFFIEPQNINDTKGLLTGSEAHHLINVLRAKPGREVELFDGCGGMYSGTIKAIHQQQVELSVQKIVSPASDSSREITLALGLPKGKIMDFLIQKATELGVDRVQPLLTRYSEKSGDDERFTKRFERWQRIMRSACKQSGRAMPMTIEHPLQLTNFDCQAFDRIIFLFEGETQRSFSSLHLNEEMEKICLLIGPEGGFHQKEAALLQEKGAVPITLGSLILRTETAAVSSIAILQFLSGGMQPTTQR